MLQLSHGYFSWFLISLFLSLFLVYLDRQCLLVVYLLISGQGLPVVDIFMVFHGTFVTDVTVFLLCC
jgi:hypothetical protein